MVGFVQRFVIEQLMRSRGSIRGGFRGVLCGLFFCLLGMNLCGLIPYVFSNTSHLVVTLVLSSVFWLGLLMSSFFYNLGSFLAVLLPVGAPSFLRPFLVLVETVRLLVRPVTLAVRLAANIGAGHIVLCLVGRYLRRGLFLSGFSSPLFILFFESFYFLFEVGICLIQSYIFFLLLSLYGDEHC